MSRRLSLPTCLLAVSLLDCGSWSSAQPPEEPQAAPLAESPPPILPPLPDEHRTTESASQDREDLISTLGELRGAVRTAPDHVEDRVRLALALYRLGDLDAAIDECRTAIRLQPEQANAHVHLGVMLIAKQEWNAAASVLKEALRLDPELAQAHYNLGHALYSLGRVNAAIQSYHQALELQPYFPDARYRLALLLKLTNKERDAARLMEEAATGGVPQARFFLGNAYKSGQGVDKNIGLAIWWWSRAAELGHQPAVEALSRLRRQALSSEQTDRRRQQDLLDGFRAYRAKLWEEHPDVSKADEGESLGLRLLNDGRPEEGLKSLLRESAALDASAIEALARLYEQGLNQRIAPFDKTILLCIESAATDGLVPAKKHLARILAKGLGIPADQQRARAMLKGLSKPESTALRDELGLH